MRSKPNPLQGTVVDHYKNCKDPPENPGDFFCLNCNMKAQYLLFCILVPFEFLLAQPKLDIADAKKNFGFVKKGEVVRIAYEISNKGDQPLLITSIEISCSCTKAEFDSQPVLPGKKTKIELLFDTHTVYDRQDRTVLVHSNDTKGPYKLRYKGVVLK